MAKITCVILGLLVAAIGIVELVGVDFDLTYVYFGVIAVGILGVLVGVYARRGGKTDTRLQTENATLKKDVEHLSQQLESEKKKFLEQSKELEGLNKEFEKEKTELNKLTQKMEDCKAAQEDAKEAAKEAKKEARQEAKKE